MKKIKKLLFLILPTALPARVPFCDRIFEICPVINSRSVIFNTRRYTRSALSVRSTAYAIVDFFRIAEPIHSLMAWTSQSILTRSISVRGEKYPDGFLKNRFAGRRNRPDTGWLTPIRFRENAIYLPYPNSTILIVLNIIQISKSSDTFLM